MSAPKRIRIDLPADVRFLDHGTRVAIVGEIVHERTDFGMKDDPMRGGITAYLEILTPQAVTFSDDVKGSDWWVVDAMSLIPSDLWHSVCTAFGLIEQAIEQPDWDFWRDLGT